MQNLKRIIEVSEAFDKRHRDPKKNFGIHGAGIRMVLKGEKGAVQFLVFSQRHLPHVQEETIERISSEMHLDENCLKEIRRYSGEFPKGKEIESLIQWQKFLSSYDFGFNDVLLKPMPADLGCHSPQPMYEGHEPMRHVYKNPKFNIGPDGEPNVTPGVYGDPLICPYLDEDSVCYYSGSGLNAEPVYDILIEKGEEATWEYLTSFYKKNFVMLHSS